MWVSYYAHVGVLLCPNEGIPLFVPYLCMWVSYYAQMRVSHYSSLNAGIFLLVRQMWVSSHSPEGQGRLEITTASSRTTYVSPAGARSESRAFSRGAPESLPETVVASVGTPALRAEGSCQRAIDREGARPSASQHRERTTLRRRRMGAANSEGSRVGAHRSPGGLATKSEPIRHRFNKVSTRRDHPHRFSSSDNSRPGCRPGPGFRPRSRFQSQSRFPSPGGRALRVAPPANVVGPRPPSRSA
jgi:hypothetical protein